MKCPICNTENPDDAKKCQCGFFLDLVDDPVEISAESAGSSSKRKNSFRSLREILFGIVWIALGVIFSLVVYFFPGMDSQTKGRYMTIGLLLLIYGIFEVYRNQKKLKITSRTKDRTKI